jgi:pimeloyl-ACP methyl ester carboxylesterase
VVALVAAFEKIAGMRRDDIEAIGDLAGDVLAAGSTLVQQVHEGIAGRPFGVLGPSAAPAREIHTGIARAVYGGVRGTLHAASRGGTAVLAMRGSNEGPELSSRPAGAATLAALNGLYGDHLARRENRLALEMEIRHGGAAVPIGPAELREAFPDARSRVAVFVHGLCETDESWRRPPLRGDTERRRTYGEQLQDELGYTPIYIRYNSGLRVSDNGRRLAELLEDLLTGWPCQVEELVLVGHSMGGLVARSACLYADRERRSCIGAIRHVFCLGSPHLGADLEKSANVLGWALGRLPETRALGSLINARSVGIKDLRFGSCMEEDWCDGDPDEFLRDRCQEVPFLPGVNYHFVAARLGEGPVGSIAGDLLVRVASASGRGKGSRQIPFEVDNGLELSGLTHFDLLNHPAVYDQLRTWIRRAHSVRPAKAPEGQPVDVDRAAKPASSPLD